MLYIITEDSGSGHEFWTEINKRYLWGKAKVVSSYGIKNIEKEVMSVNLKDNKILLVFDKNPAMTAYRIIKKMKKYISNNEEYKGKIAYISGYCFEEIVLNSKNTDIIADSNYRQKMKECVERNINVAKTTEYVEIKNNSRRGLNREEIAFQEMSKLLINTGTKITKKKLGKCWIGGKCSNKGCKLRGKCREANGYLLDIASGICETEKFLRILRGMVREW